MWFNTLIIEPFTNLMLFTYSLVGENFVLSIVLLTVLVRGSLIPLTLRQQESQKKMQEMQPQLKAIQEKYKDDPQRMQKELGEIGYNPLSMVGGCLPMLIQMPIWIGLYRAILYAIPNGPVAMMDLYNAHYSFLFPNFASIIPINSIFLWFDLGAPDRLYLPILAGIGIPILPVLVGLSTFLQQKFMTPPQANADPNDQSQQMQRSMMMTMPLMLAFFAYQFASGLSIYFIVSNLIGMFQFAYTNRDRLEWKTAPVASFIRYPSFKAPDDTSKNRRTAASPATGITGGSGSASEPAKKSRRKKATIADDSSQSNGKSSGSSKRKKRSRRRR